jgi:HD-GYP domain-containing protein (c-di-GMP phosphodiesterase class II)
VAFCEGFGGGVGFPLGARIIAVADAFDTIIFRLTPAARVAPL